MTDLEALAEFLNIALKADQFIDVVDDLNGIYRPSTRSIQRIGLIREPWLNVADWVQANQIDALFCHRPWKLPLDQLPDELGILAYHLSFDEALTIGYNPLLADCLEMSNLAVLGTKLERPIGMIGDIKTQDLNTYVRQVEAIFGGLEETEVNPTQVSRVAVVGAMTAELIHMASHQRAELYITGQRRRSAELAVQATKINIIAVGHQRSEEWGIHALAYLLQQRWTALEVVLPPSDNEFRVTATGRQPTQKTVNPAQV